MRHKIQLVALLSILLSVGSGCGYNKMVTMREAIDAAWAQVENQLQRRNDLVPNLVEVTKGYEGNRPHTSCRLTKSGRRRFLDYLAVLERLVRDAAKAAGRDAPPFGRLGIIST